MKRQLLLLLATLLLITYLPAQHLDPSFGSGGKLVLSDVLAAPPLAVQPDGKIIVAGSTLDNASIVISRLNPDGTPDNGFGSGGKAYLPKANQFDAPTDVKVQADDKLVVALRSGLARLNPDGSFDHTFNGTGTVTFAINNAKLLLQPDGKIVVAGNIGPSIALRRFNPDGTPDVNFGNGGTATHPTLSGLSPNDSSPVSAVVQQSDGKLVVVGYAFNGLTQRIEFYAMRFTPGGLLDNTYANGGYRFIGVPNAVFVFASSALLDAGNHLIITGWGIGNSFYVAKLDANGNLDNSFNQTGILTLGFGLVNAASALQPDGKLLLAGDVTSNLDFGVARLNADGTLDQSFNGTGKMGIDFYNTEDRTANIALLSDGSILLAGSTKQDGLQKLSLLKLTFGSGPLQTFYRDADSDGYGDAALPVQAAIKPRGYVSNRQDCNDADATVHSPFTYYRDGDGDGYGDVNGRGLFCSSTPPAGYVRNYGDCDDTDPTVYRKYTFFRDADGDGVGDAGSSIYICHAATPPAGYVKTKGDCDDGNAAIQYARIYYRDADGDGFGDKNGKTLICSLSTPAGYVTNFGDCDDNNAAVHNTCTTPVTTQTMGKGTAPVQDAVVTFTLAASPNPVAKSARIMYTVPVDAQVNIKVYDVLGREVNTLFSGQRSAGTYSQEYNTRRLSQGVYYCRMIATANGKQYGQTQKLVKAE